MVSNGPRAISWITICDTRVGDGAAGGVRRARTGRRGPVLVLREGPGRYYHPGMFPIMRQLIGDRTIKPGTYELTDFVPSKNEKDPALTAGLSNYSTDIRSDDYPLRALMFGAESGLISGRVVVNPDNATGLFCVFGVCNGMDVMPRMRCGQAKSDERLWSRRNRP
jgi:hypothetical protein